MTFRQILLASAAVGALLPAAPALSGDDLIVAQHYKDFTDRRVTDSAGRNFVKYFTTKAILPATQDNVVMPLLETFPTAAEQFFSPSQMRRVLLPSCCKSLKSVQRAGDIPALIAELDELRKKGIVTEAEFQKKKAELLAKM